ncbi:GlxA family transcriptional regulator [Primorskyibacter sp. S87]|uniref:GlxA family transcriptional regulator n=1 Tax=Primorskyibacter sp. S87 TaxID=3415126 RepID=UPI003C7E707C
MPDLRIVQEEPETWHFDIAVTDGFVLTELAAVVDPLRLANRVCPRPPFSYNYRSANGGMVESSSGAFVQSEPLPKRPTAQYLFVIGNTDPDCPGLSMGRAIHDYTFRNAQVFLLAEAASRFIQDNGETATGLATHWENTSFLSERSAPFEASYALASSKGQIVTCAGMGATVDVTLSVIGRHISSAAKLTVANILLHEKIRDLETLQPIPGLQATTTGDDITDRCLELMQANVEEPLPIQELVTLLGVSNRSLERKFRTFLGATPSGFYREMRLARANTLLLNTTMSVRDVGLACGFPNGFSSVFKSFFGITPFALRRRGRAGAW